ncbi:MAG: DNA repair protein RecN [Candidatus Marinimicrobia bacterium]|nr:DNA repair protein RecN [Candidatus Neomarinimicrobiota bacterium]
MIILEKLIVNNYAIIDNIEVNFRPGFNVITGETGAGKSIVIHALNLALGQKADISKIRSGAQEAEVVSRFRIYNDLPAALQIFLKENELPFDGTTLHLKRKMFDTGRSFAWINDKPCSINLLKSLGAFLVDMHGQHAHQQLLNVETHLDYLDNYGNYDELLTTVKERWQNLNFLKNKLTLLLQKQQLNKEKQELWQFQFDEISRVDPQPGELEELEKEQKLLANAERYHELAHRITQSVYEGDETIYNQLQMIIQQLRELNAISHEFDTYLNSLEQTQYLFQELSNDVSNSADNIEYNPLRLEEISNRLEAIFRLQKKYGSNIEDIVKYKHELDEKLNQEGSLEFDIMQVRKSVKEAEKQFLDSVGKLSKVRQKTASSFEKDIENQLIKLGFQHSKFEVKINTFETPNERGIDCVEFYIRTNPGEPMRPLVETVSGGEVSRIMLALKSILAAGDNIPVLIFDEIDTGISGQIARIVGEEMVNLSSNHQILCITHLPQIASLGKTHLAVRKKIVNNRSVTYMENLDEIQRVDEVAQLIGGKEVTESGLNQARELLNL